MSHYCHYCRKPKEDFKSQYMCVDCFKQKKAAHGKRYWAKYAKLRTEKQLAQRLKFLEDKRAKRIIFSVPVYIPVEPVNESLIEKTFSICNYFDCPKELSLIEKLCGNVCTAHMGVEETVFHNGLL